MPSKKIAAFEGRVELVITDVVMPLIGGFDLAGLLRIRRPDIKLLFMSRYTGDQAFNPENVDGKVSFLQKPFTPMTLTRKVRELLDAD